MTLTVTSIKQVEHIIEVEFWNLQVFKIFKYFKSTVSSIWLMLLKKQIHVIISKENGWSTESFAFSVPLSQRISRAHTPKSAKASR